MVILFSGEYIIIHSPPASCFPKITIMEIQNNNTFNLSEKEDNLEDFEEFDFRDAINVGAYSVMSASKVLFLNFKKTKGSLLLSLKFFGSDKEPKERQCPCVRAFVRPCVTFLKRTLKMSSSCIQKSPGGYQEGA